MTRKFFVSALTLALGLAASTAYAADRTVPAALPKLLPKSAPEATGLQLNAPLPAGVAMAPKMSKPVGADALIDGLTAIKASRGGKVMEVPLPDGLRMMLKMPVKQGKITPKPGGGGQLTQVKSTTDFPYATMGLLGSGCSGTLVAGRFVITAAMCLYDVKNQKFYDNLDFHPGINGNEQPFGVAKWQDAYVPKGYTAKGDLQYEFGLVVLEPKAGDQTGWMGFGHLEKFDLKQVTLTGYPWDGVPQQTEWQTSCNMDAAESNFLFYRCPGQSKALASMTGSPLWFKGKADDAWQIVGIHNYAQDDKKTSWWALRLNQANTETLLSWIDDANKAGGGNDNGDTGGGTTDNGGGTGKADCTCDGGDN
jgi:V8-like Glu-specific endopeptidase